MRKKMNNMIIINKVTTLLFVVLALIPLCSGLPLPRVFVATEARANYLYKHLDVWASVEFTSVTNLVGLGNSEAAAVVVDEKLYSIFSSELNSLLNQQIPLIVVNMDAKTKDLLINELSFGSTGNSYIYGVLPFTDSNNLTHYRTVHVPEFDLTSVLETITTENGYYDSISKLDQVSLDLDASAKLFSDELFACVEQGVYDPPANMTPPAGALYAILPTTILGSYVVNLTDMHKSGSQTISHRLDNVFFNYRQNGYGEDGYYTVLMQDGIVSPGNLITNDPSTAIGFYQYSFSVNNQPYPLGTLPSSSNYYWARSSPATVDQTISITNQVTESISLEVDMTVNGPSSKLSVTWTASTTTTSEIEQWGIVEDTNPTNSSTSWTYHQQLPYDPFELQFNNFPKWWSAAYSGDSVKSVPELSTNTLQIHTISAWYASGALRTSAGTLPVTTTSWRQHAVGLIGLPNYYNGHHIFDVGVLDFADSFKMDLNSFPNSV